MNVGLASPVKNMNFGIRATRPQFQLLAAMAIVATAFVGSPTAARAKCFEAAQHFRGGQWTEWILHVRPGPLALSRAEQIINEINVPRIAKQLPALAIRKDGPIIFGVIDETNVRSPNGERLKKSSNQEVFFATFAVLPPGESVIVFIDDPLRSNGELTSAGVPGREAVITVQTQVELRAAASDVSTKWIAQTERGDHIQFRAKYTTADVGTVSTSPSSQEYLACNMSNLGTVVFRSLPLQGFSLLDRHQAEVINDLARPTVEVDLKVKLVDPVLDAIFNDPDNRFVRLIKVDRVARVERRP